MTKTIEQKYKKLTDVEHALARPGRYIGSVKPCITNSHLVVDGKMMKRDITWNPGLLKLFDEVISNSVDHSKRKEGNHLNTIKVEVDRITGEISVWDNGGIPIEMHKDHEEYVPTLIFGYLRSGSNFDDTEDSTGTGQNGEGASLTNIFSTKYIVESSDGKKKFLQIWTKNMMEKTDAEISEYNGKGYTKITFIPDYAHINTELNEDNYNKIIKRVYDIAGCNPTLKIYFNNERIKINSFKDYISLYEDKFEYDDNENWQIGITASDDGFQHVSFVNSTETLQGGTHLQYVWHQIAIKIREYINKKHKIDVVPNQIQSHMKIFINATIVRPRYDSQTKENMITPVNEYKTSWTPSDKFIKRVIESGIIDRVLSWAEAKAKAEEMRLLRELSKDIDRGNPRRVDKFSDALEDHDRHLCEIYLSEGDSARKSIHEARGKNPYIGSFALKGKPLNVMDVDMKRVIGGKDKDDNGNNEIKSILKITGLKIGEKVKSVKDLRFGKIVILSDQDLDGAHISSLLINFFAYFWPELFELGIIYRMNTPLIIATVKSKEYEFMTDISYEEWSKTAPKHDIMRYKGLGKFKTQRFKQILENREKYLIRIAKIEDIDKKFIELAFKGSLADDRKEWLSDVNYFNNFE